MPNDIQKFFGARGKGVQGKGNPANYEQLYAAGEISKEEYEYWKQQQAKMKKARS